MSNLSQFVLGPTGGGMIPIEVLAVGGGGGGDGVGGSSFIVCCAGGGGGQFVYTHTFAASKISHQVTIGAGGAGTPGSGSPNPGTPGGNTYFSSLVTAGGGKGACGTFSGFTPEPARSAYGSGGGHYSGAAWPSALPYKQIKLTETIAFGAFSRESILSHDGCSYQNPGGGGKIAAPPPNYPGGNGGGGGGAGAAGEEVTAGGPSNGGIGMPSAIIGGVNYFGAGGGNGQGNGGVGGGGDGGSTGGNGVAGTGGGGGGGDNVGGFGSHPGGNGGSGIVVVRYPTSYAAATVTNTTPTPPQAGYHVYAWITPGTITFN